MSGPPPVLLRPLICVLASSLQDSFRLQGRAPGRKSDVSEVRGDSPQESHTEG